MTPQELDQRVGMRRPIGRDPRAHLSATPGHYWWRWDWNDMERDWLHYPDADIAAWSDYSRRQSVSRVYLRRHRELKRRQTILVWMCAAILVPVAALLIVVAYAALSF